MRKPHTLSLIPLICLLLSVTTAFADGASNRNAMAEAMVRMMEAMGFLNAGADAAKSMATGQMPALPNPYSMSGWGMPMPGMPGGMPTPGGDTMGQASHMGSAMMDQFSQSVPGMDQMQQIPGMPQMQGMGSKLAGVWEGAGGGLLIVQGNNYRLYAPNCNQLDGTIRVSGDRVTLTNPQAGFDLDFEYALDQGRLALRDNNGQVFLYRQLILDGGG